MVGRTDLESGAEGRRGSWDQPGPDLVEAARAVDGAIGPRRKGHHRLVAAGVADRGVLLAGPAHADALCVRSTAWAALGHVHQPLLGEEALLAARKDEAVA